MFTPHWGGRICRQHVTHQGDRIKVLQHHSIDDVCRTAYMSHCCMARQTVDKGFVNKTEKLDGRKISLSQELYGHCH